MSSSVSAIALPVAPLGIVLDDLQAGIEHARVAVLPDRLVNEPRDAPDRLVQLDEGGLDFRHARLDVAEPSERCITEQAEFAEDRSEGFSVSHVISRSRSGLVSSSSSASSGGAGSVSRVSCARNSALMRSTPRR